MTKECSGTISRDTPNGRIPSRTFLSRSSVGQTGIRSDASRLVAYNIDGTLIRTGSPATSAVRTAAAEVRAAGHHLVLATGRSLAGALPVALQLGLDDAWILVEDLREGLAAVLVASR